MKLVLNVLAAMLFSGCATNGDFEPWLDKQVSGDSIFYFHSTSGSIVIGVNKDAVEYCASRGKSAVLASRNPDGYMHFHSNYLCQ